MSVNNFEIFSSRFFSTCSDDPTAITDDFSSVFQRQKYIYKCDELLPPPSLEQGHNNA
jgi:hypothetical protein